MHGQPQDRTPAQGRIQSWGEGDCDAGVKVSEEFHGEFTAIASDLFCSGRDRAAREV